jgi:hypothetical protein
MRGPPEVPPAFVADIPAVPCPSHLSAYCSLLPKGGIGGAGDGYWRLKLDLRSPYGFATVKFLPVYGLFYIAYSNH